MSRRSKPGGKPVKTRRRKAATLKHHIVPKVMRPQSSSASGPGKIARLVRERDEALQQLSEALEQQTATSEVLKIVSSSPGELESVFEAILENAVRICDANFGNLWLREGNKVRIVAIKGASKSTVSTSSANL